MMARRIILVLAAGLLAGGCEPENNRLATPQRPERTARARGNPYERLQGQLSERDQRIQELMVRSNTLSDQVNRLTFMNEQLNKQLAVVADSPRERDRYKRLSTDQAVELQRLRERLAAMRDRVNVDVTTQPATPPAN